MSVDSDDGEEPAPLEITDDDFKEAIENGDPFEVFQPNYLKAAAMMKENEPPKWARVRALVKECDQLPTNDFRDYVRQEQENGNDGSEDSQVEPEPPEKPPEPEVEKSWPKVRDDLNKLFDERLVRLAEAFATVPVRMLFEDELDCPMVVAVGNPSTAKSTVNEWFEGLNITQVHDIVSSKAWISHNTDNEDGRMDLLPRVAQHVMVAPEMNTWFTGDDVEERISMLCRISDGKGLSKTTGAQGTTEYRDENGAYRLGLMGSTTPPTKAAWIVLADKGSRFVFFQMPKEESLKAQAEMLDENYKAKNELAKEAITNWWRTFWHDHDGSIATEDRPTVTEKQKVSIGALTRIMGRGRAVDFGDDVGKVGVDRSEQETRGMGMLMRMAQARALMYGRDAVNSDDLEMCARAAFASMPEWRKPIVKMLCSPHHTGPYEARHVQKAIGVARSTALDHMKEAGRLKIADYCLEEPDKGQERSTVRLADKKLRGVFEGDGEDHVKVPWPYPEGEYEPSNLDD